MAECLLLSHAEAQTCRRIPRRRPSLVQSLPFVGTTLLPSLSFSRSRTICTVHKHRYGINSTEKDSLFLQIKEKCGWVNWNLGLGEFWQESGQESYLATARSTWGSCSHFFRASTLLVLRWGLASKNTASAQRIPNRKKWVLRCDNVQKLLMNLLWSRGGLTRIRTLLKGFGHECVSDVFQSRSVFKSNRLQPRGIEIKIAYYY